MDMFRKVLSLSQTDRDSKCVSLLQITVNYRLFKLLEIPADWSSLESIHTARRERTKLDHYVGSGRVGSGDVSWRYAQRSVAFVIVRCAAK